MVATPSKKKSKFTYADSEFDIAHHLKRSLLLILMSTLQGSSVLCQKFKGNIKSTPFIWQPFALKVEATEPSILH